MGEAGHEVMLGSWLLMSLRFVRTGENTQFVQGLKSFIGNFLVDESNTFCLGC